MIDSVSKMDDNKICPQCGAQIAKNAKFCKNCGYKFEDNIKREVTTEQYVNEYIQQTKTEKNNNFSRKVLFLLVLIIFAVILLIKVSKPTPSPTIADSSKVSFPIDEQPYETKEEYIEETVGETEQQYSIFDSDTEPEDIVLEELDMSDFFISRFDRPVSWYNENNIINYYMIPIREKDGSYVIYFNSENTLDESANVYYMKVDSISRDDGTLITGIVYDKTASYGVFNVYFVTTSGVDVISVNKDAFNDTNIKLSGEFYYYGEVEDIPIISETDEVNNTAATVDNNTGNVAAYDEYILPDSDKRYLTENDVAGMDLSTLRLAINEIYARHGRAFETEDLNEYFSSKSWYTPMYSQEEFDTMGDSIFNDYEKKNIEFLAAVRESLNSASQVSETQLTEEQSATPQFTEDYVYGTYYHEFDESHGVELEIYFYQIINIRLGGSYNGGSGSFIGYIESQNGNEYIATNSAGREIVFTYNGLDTIEVLSDSETYNNGFPGFKGIYTKVAE